MTIKNVHLNHLRNDEHFQFIQFVLTLTKEVGADKLKVAAQYSALAALHAQEDEALKKITKSAHTAEINAADRERDTLFRGMTDAVKSARGHFLAEMREAAERIMIVLDTYGNLAAKSHIEETAAVYNLCSDLQTKYQTDATRLALMGWIAELQRLNSTVETLLGSRADEGAIRSSLVLKEVRAKVNEAYRAFTTLLQAQATVASADGNAATITMYNSFINRLNERIDIVNNVLAQRRGIAAAAERRKQEAGERN